MPMRFRFIMFCALLLAGVLSASMAEASRARLKALGQDPEGSLYIMDERSIFLNPALAAKYGSFANFELGSQGTGTTFVNPQAEGGAMIARGEMRYGMQLSRLPMMKTLVDIANGPANANGVRPYPQNSFELIAAGGGAQKWGFAFLYANSEAHNENTNPVVLNAKASAFEFRGGIADDKWNAYGKLLLYGTSEIESPAATTNKMDARPSLEGGATLDLNADQRVYGKAGFQMFAYRTAPSATDLDGYYTFLSGGFTQFMSPEAATRLFMSGGLSYVYTILKAPAGGTDAKTDYITLPVAIGLESQMNDWLTLRASVTQNVFLDLIRSSVTNSNRANTTVVALGTGFKWKKLSIDSVLEGSTGMNSTGSLNGTNLLGYLGATYAF